MIDSEIFIGYCCVLDGDGTDYRQDLMWLPSGQELWWLCLGLQGVGRGLVGMSARC